MSMEGAGQCGICGAYSDYCHLETPTGVSIDCRNLKLVNPKDLEWNIGLAESLRESRIPRCGINDCEGDHWPQNHNEAMEHGT